MRNKKKIQQKNNGGLPKRTTLKNIQRLFFRSQLVLVISLAVFLGVAGTLINMHFETEKRDQNLQNVAEAIARSPLLAKNNAYSENEMTILTEYLDSLKETLEDIDVISVVNVSSIRVYHSNHSLIGTVYDGNWPKFDEGGKGYYASDETGPSGSQRRAYAAIYDEDGNYVGFVMAIMLMKNIQIENLQMLFIFLVITIVAILIDLIISAELSQKVKQGLMGYEPDVFTAMYKMRDNILETLEEGILAVDKNGMVQFANDAAVHMLKNEPDFELIGKSIDVIGDRALSDIMANGGKKLNASIEKADIIIDRVPIKEDGKVVGAIAVLHDRAEYTKLMEDLSGTRYLVDSMRANNHDFTNKLHVILGLIQMEMYEEATSYIQNITMVQREMISKVMHAVSEPAVAALLIGKIARASELNVKFVLRESCHYAAADMNVPSEMLITVIGNILDNAFDAMNESSDFGQPKELLFGIFSKPGAMLITADDTGMGIKEEDLEHIFENGYSTKGEGRGTGLYQVKTMVENFGGRITVESQEGIGTSFSVSFVKENENK
uniref:sensor histidine kinase n=1 Tax=Agathobacter sp. TaxID=2021311 RepID=UPI0040563B11